MDEMPDEGPADIGVRRETLEPRQTMPKLGLRDFFQARMRSATKWRQLLCRTASRIHLACSSLANSDGLRTWFAALLPSDALC